VRELGSTPIAEIEIPIGSYVLEIEHEGRERVQYPVLIEREKHWDGVPPGGSVGRSFSGSTSGMQSIRSYLRVSSSFSQSFS
jgi:hypothetical protein